jgi:predicted nuclease with RNAse H fold
MLVAFGGSSSFAALILGVIACIATRETRRWAWYVSFLALTVLVVAAPTILLLNANAPSFGFTHQDDSLLLWAVSLLPPALAILTFIYLRALAVMERGQTIPLSPPGTATSPPS